MNETNASVTIQILTAEQFIMRYKVVRTLKCVDETLVCDHSNES